MILNVIQDEVVEEDVQKEKLLALCDKEELKTMIELLYSNSEKRTKIAEKKLKLLLYNNGRLKAKIVDFENTEQILRKKEKDYDRIKDELNKLSRSHTQKNEELISTLTKSNDDEKMMSELFMNLAEARSELATIQGEKENLFYFLQEALKKMKKKDDHFAYAVSALSEKDQEAVKALYKDLGLKM